MFSKKFRKASKDIKVSKAVLQDTRQKMLETAAPPVKRMRYFIKAAVSFACIAAVAFAGIWEVHISVPQQESGTLQTVKNLFSITAYAYEQQGDGQLKPKEIDLSQNRDSNGSEYIIAISGGENNEYVGKEIKLLGIECKGTTIEKVDFRIDNGTLKIPNQNWATEKQLENLESKGKQLTVDYSKGVHPEIYWESDPFNIKFESKEGATFKLGESQEEGSIPILTPSMSARISVTAHFKDGSQTEKSIVYDASKGSIIVEETK
jgi:hypothetical protein